MNRTWYVCEHILLITCMHIHQCVYAHDIYRYEHDTHIRLHIYWTYIYKHTCTHIYFVWFWISQQKIQQVLWLFHDNGNKRLAPLVHPPRLDGGKKGIFATRTPHRPNPIGLFCSCLPFRFSFWLFPSSISFQFLNFSVLPHAPTIVVFPPSECMRVYIFVNMYVYFPNCEDSCAKYSYISRELLQMRPHNIWNTRCVCQSKVYVSQYIYREYEMYVSVRGVYVTIHI